MDRIDNGLKSNAEFGFLYKKTHIRPVVISAIALVPEYMDALKAYKGSLTDQSVYEVLKETYRRMIEENKGYRTARDVMNKVSADVTGNSFSWHSDITDMHTKFGYLFKKSLLNKANLTDLLFLSEFTSELEKINAGGKGIEDIDIYNLLKKLYFPLLKQHQTEGFKESYKSQNGPDKYKEWSHKFRILGRALRKLSESLYEDNQWQKDYEEFYTKLYTAELVIEI